MLSDPAYTVPPPGPPGPFGTLPWLRATVSRFSEGPTHARRRASVEAMLAELDPAELREAARRAARDHVAARRPAAPAAAAPGPAATPPAPATTPLAAVPLPYLPVAVLAEATGVAPGDVPGAVEAVRVVAAAYHPGTRAAGADAALARLIALLPAGEPEVVAQRVALLVQACEATAALVRGALERPLADVLRDSPPVPATRRRGPDGEIVAVPLAGLPFGAGPRRCPGEAHARALATGVVEGAR